MVACAKGALVAVMAVLFTLSVTAAEDIDKIKIAFASPYATYCAPYLVAKELGWFKELGLETEDIILTNDANATRALITGASDVAMTGPLNVFNAIENGAAIKWIGSWQTSADYVVVTSPSIHELSELQGKTFASSGPSGLPQALPIMLLKKLGVPTDKIKFVAVGGHSARLQAVMAGKADAALVNEITGITGEKLGAVHILTTVQKYFPHLGYIVLAVRTEDISAPSKRSAFEKLMAGSIRGARFIMKNPEQSAQLLQKYLKDVDKDLIVKVLQNLNEQNVWPIDGGLDPEVTEFTSQLEYDLGETKRVYSVGEVTDGTAVAAALRKEGASR
jgi:NitT/TauT family transport system substrate-binding protein